MKAMYRKRYAGISPAQLSGALGFGILLCVAIAAYAIHLQGQEPATRASRPKLVVLVVIDQMRADYFQRYADRFKDGFKRLADQGAVFSEAHYPYASTKTAEAHALMLSGWSPSGTGIVADQWYDRATKGTVVAGASSHHKLVGGSGEGGSPEQLLVHTVGDALKEHDSHSIVLAASWKRYAAVLNGGQHPNAAYWFDPASGHMVTSDYYTMSYPSWVQDFNKTDLTAPFFGKTWLTHPMGSGTRPDEPYRTAFRATPYSNEVLLEFAQRLFERSGVGKDSDPDLVAISFSGLDYVGHLYGPETAGFDATIEALDHQVGELLRTLDEQFGAGNYTLALTADHGAALNPEKEKLRGHDAGRLSTDDFRSAVEKAVAGKLQINTPVIVAFEPPELYLNYAAAGARGVSRQALDRAVAQAIEAQPGIARAYTADEIAIADGSNDALLQAVAAGYYASRSGDIHVLVKPNYIFWGAQGTTHGTPYDYDSHVPLIFFGAQVKPGKIDRPVRVNDLAPTIGRLLKVTFQGDPNGQVLTEALRP